MRHFLLSTAVCLSFAMPAVAADYNADTVLAVVNGKNITLGHLIALEARLPEQYKSLDNGTLYNGMLDQLIDQALIADTIAPDAGSDNKRTRLTLDNERNSYLAGLVVNRIGSEAVSEEDLQKAYDDQFGNYAAAKEYNASHILVASEDEAKELIMALEGGADFAELAKEKSTGPSGPNGGQLGWFGTGAMVPAFEAAVVALDAGAISAPVQTQFGWHVVKLNETRDIQPPSLDEVRNDLSQQIIELRVRAGLEELRGAAKIERIEIDVPASAIREGALIDGD